MYEKLSNLSPKKKELLIKKLNLNLNRLYEEPADLNLKRPFGYHIPTSNFSKIERKNYEVSPPGPYQVQIQAKAISLNFRDLMIGLGLYPKIEGIPMSMGGDYSGIIVACGEKVKNFKIGDEVIVLYGGDPEINFHFCSHINTFTCQMVLKPHNLSFQESCCIPTVFLTAYSGLYYHGNLSKNEKVLIHTASGGVGLAAIQVAKWRGAEIFGTAGTEEKRSFLKSIGIRNVMSSRSIEFYDQILACTKGAGIDVILNTLPGEALEKGMKLLKNFGRFIHLDKTDIYKKRLINLDLFKKSISFTFFDLSVFYADEKIRNILEEVSCLFKKKVFSPLPFRIFSNEDLANALNAMTMSNHIGKIVLNFE